MVNGRPRNLRIEEECTSLDRLSHQETDRGEHGNAAVSDLGLAVLAESRLVGVGGEAEGVPDAHGLEGAGDGVDGEGLRDGLGGASEGGRGEGNGGAGEEGGDCELHGCFVFGGLMW